MRECRFCKTKLDLELVDLGAAPLSNSYLASQEEGEQVFPQRVMVCRSCRLVQLPEFTSPKDIFTDYAYFSSYSKSYLEHAKRYVQEIQAEYQLEGEKEVIEIASNDGYLLQYFQNVRILGIEPSQNVAQIAAVKGIPTLTEFFSESLATRLAESGHRADLIIGNNVLAHTPTLNDFVRGLKVLLKPTGIITLEFPHLLNLLLNTEFDTIYHEHFSYFSLYTVKTIFEHFGMRIFKVKELATHGGSLRIYACHADSEQRPDGSVERLIEREQQEGLLDDAIYQGFSEKVREIKFSLLELLIRLKREGRTIAAYGAAAKGNTLLNYSGIREEFIDYVVDKNPYKQGRYLPGSRLAIYPPEKIAETKPDYILILPWNIQAEIIAELSYTKAWGAKFITAIPKVEVLD